MKTKKLTLFLFLFKKLACSGFCGIFGILIHFYDSSPCALKAKRHVLLYNMWLRGGGGVLVDQKLGLKLTAGIS
jgi:hypothetical protein